MGLTPSHCSWRPDYVRSPPLNSTLEKGVKRVRWSFFSLLLLALPLSNAFAQTRVVSGTVRAETGEPLAQASIGVQGTATGTYTDDQGRFSISVPAGLVTLRIRRIGFTQKMVPVGPAASDVSVSLARDVLQLETQVVTGTATTVSSVNAANAVTVISAESSIAYRPRRSTTRFRARCRARRSPRTPAHRAAAFRS